MPKTTKKVAKPGLKPRVKGRQELTSPKVQLRELSVAVLLPPFKDHVLLYLLSPLSMVIFVPSTQSTSLGVIICIPVHPDPDLRPSSEERNLSFIAQCSGLWVHLPGGSNPGPATCSGGQPETQFPLSNGDDNNLYLILL